MSNIILIGDKTIDLYSKEFHDTIKSKIDIKSYGLSGSNFDTWSNPNKEVRINKWGSLIKDNDYIIPEYQDSIIEIIDNEKPKLLITSLGESLCNWQDEMPISWIQRQINNYYKFKIPCIHILPKINNDKEKETINFMKNIISNYAYVIDYENVNVEKIIEIYEYIEKINTFEFRKLQTLSQKALTIFCYSSNELARINKMVNHDSIQFYIQTIYDYIRVYGGDPEKYGPAKDVKLLYGE